MNRLITIGFVYWVLGSSWSLAEDPVDNQVKNALADIARFETHFSGKSSVSASQVKRTLKLLTLTRQRLDKSTNQSHTSWKATDGVLESSCDQAGADLVFTTSHKIGADNRSGNSPNYHGQLDELRIAKRALSQSELRFHWNNLTRHREFITYTQD